MFYGIWIDYNNDGSYDGAEEFLKNASDTTFNARIVNLAIANNSDYAGKRRLRVKMRSNGGFTEADACNAIGSTGETEDYMINLIPVPDLQGTNYITPNGDGYNDYFVVKGRDPFKVNKTRVKVFEVNGNVVFDSGKDNEYDNLWGGTDSNGNALASGIYYYIITQGEGDNYKEIKTFLEIKK